MDQSRGFGYGAAKQSLSRRMPSAWSRRDLLLLSGSGAFLLAAKSHRSQLSVESYVFQQYAARQKKPLGDVLAEVIPMASTAGFRYIELNQEFFVPALRDRLLSLIRANELTMPSVYAGGAMHEPGLAEQTIQHALEIGAICKPFGCEAVVNNPNPKPGGAPKSDEELATQAQWLNRLGATLAERGLQLRVHHHSPEMAENAREWRHILHNTNTKDVSLCMDLDWVHQGGQDPLALLREAGTRVTEIHLRNSRNKVWLESLEDGDIDYPEIARYLRESGLHPLLVVELAYRDNTVVTRPLSEDLRISRTYAEKVFGSSA